MARKKAPITILVKRGKHRTQPFTIRVDEPGNAPLLTIAERYADRDGARRGALRKLARMGKLDKQPVNRDGSPKYGYCWNGRPVQFIFKALLPFVLALQINAQTIDLATQFGITNASTKTLSGAGYTYSTAKAKYKAGVEWLEYLGATQAEVLACYEFAIATATAVWIGDAWPLGTAFINYANGCQSRAHVILPHGGNFRTNIALPAAHGIIEGQGSSVYFDGTTTTGGTGISVDHATWLTRLFPERFIFRSTTWGQGVEGQYAEGLTIRNLYLNGGKKMQPHDPTYVSAGIAIAQAGSTSLVSQVIAYGFNTAGILLVGAIPASMRDVRCFYNGRAGVLCSGTALSTIYMDAVEFDDNGRAILIEPGYGNAGGGTITISAKSENGKNKIGGTTVRPMPLIEARGAFNIVVNGWSAATYAGKTDYAFILDPQSFQASLSLRGFRHCGHPSSSEFAYLLRDATHRWNMPQQCAPVNVEWTANGTMTASRTLTRLTADVTPPHDPNAPLYAVNFGEVNNPRQIPGCAKATGNAVGSISGGRMITNTYTTYTFLAPIRNVGRVVLRGCVIRDGKHRMLNNATETFAGWFHQPVSTITQGSWTQFATGDWEIVYTEPVTLTHLLGWAGRANTTPMTVAMIEVYPMQWEGQAP